MSDIKWIVFSCYIALIFVGIRSKMTEDAEDYLIIIILRDQHQRRLEFDEVANSWTYSN